MAAIAEGVYKVIGLMSGTSLDGVDMACCRFQFHSGHWEFSIEEALTIPYPLHLKNRLSGSMHASSLELARLHSELGHYLGRLVRDFIEQKSLSVSLVSSHGHTIFHNPSEHYTCQIGDGAALASECGLPVVCDLRSLDVAYGGQGAPLVPGGESVLFREYDSCLNLGGFANISYRTSNQYRAFDISPCNLVLNHLAARMGLEFDANGNTARLGTLIPGLLRALNNLAFYSIGPPKSLGREWVEQEIIPLLSTRYDVPDLLKTFSEHIATQVSIVVPSDIKNILVTGGGAHNRYLVERIQSLTRADVIIPEPLVVDFKEALIFAFLGLLRFLGMPNCLSSVTGARKDVCGGALYLP